MPTPEELARINIDKQLTACGWNVQSRGEMNLYAGRGVAVREFPRLRGGCEMVAGLKVGMLEGFTHVERLRQAMLLSAFEE